MVRDQFPLFKEKVNRVGGSRGVVHRRKRFDSLELVPGEEHCTDLLHLEPVCFLLHLYTSVLQCRSMYISSLEKSNLVHYPVSFCFGKWGCCSLTPTARDWEQRRTDKFIGGQPNPPFHFQPLPPALKNCLYFLEETFIWNCVFNLVLFIFYN